MDATDVQEVNEVAMEETKEVHDSDVEEKVKNARW